MLVSFVTVNFNNAQGLEKTLAALSQLKERVQASSAITLELIVVDGLSGPEDQAVIEKYRHGLDTVSVEVDGGIFDAMNKGVRLANGDRLDGLVVALGDPVRVRVVGSSVIRRQVDFELLEHQPRQGASGVEAARGRRGKRPEKQRGKQRGKRQRKGGRR